jgi:hypothetical protein
MKKEKVHDYSLILLFYQQFTIFWNSRERNNEWSPAWTLEGGRKWQVKISETGKKIMSKTIDEISDKFLEKKS